MKFVLNRDHVFASTLGHSIRFEKNEPTYVPPALYREVMGIGAIPDEEVPEDKKESTSTEPTEPHLREKAMVEVFEKLVLANKSGDFTAGGVPKDKAMERELGWAVDSKETAELWKKFKAGELK
jgi:hypothetical protein